MIRHILSDEYSSLMKHALMACHCITDLSGKIREDVT